MIPRSPSTISTGTVPIGGTTGLSHEHSAAIDEAATWLAATPAGERPAPVVPMLRSRFGLSPIEAVQAIRSASDIRSGGLRDG